MSQKAGPPPMDIPAGIFVFVCIRLNGRAEKSLTAAVDKASAQTCGIRLPSRDGIFRTTAFPSVSQALTFVRQAHEILRRTPMAASPAIGIEGGDVPPNANLARLVPLNRAEELADLAFDGQNLIGPTARELARPCLPAGFGIIELGELKLGGSISADRVSQLSIAGFKSDFDRQDEFEEVESNVPDAPEGFIGRDHESREVRMALTDSRLVSLIGPAGVGKSALAHWLAADLMEAYRDGSWKVDLAKIPKGGSVATAIAADLKLPSMSGHTNEERVLISLSTMDGLIWLDNCEHVIEETRALLPKIFLRCPKVTILVTSQTALGIDGEIQVDLKPFDLPETAEDVGDLEAVRLFLSRARRANASFAASPSDLEIIVDVCRKCGGLPLAIELAAAQLPNRSIAELRDQLFEALSSSTVQGPARFKTLDRALEWSYSLLDDRDKQFLRTLGVLAGPTNKELVLKVGGSNGAKKELSEKVLEKLVHSSLVQSSKFGSTRYYKLLEPVRHFALSQLERNDEERAAKNKFAKACLDWLLELKNLRLPFNRWLVIVERESSNLGEALDWLLTEPRGGSVALHICVELFDLWLNKGPYDNAYLWFSKAAERGKPPEGVCAADVRNWVGVFAGYAGRFADCQEALEQALVLYEQEGKKNRQATVHTNLAWNCRNIGELEAGLVQAQKAASLADPADPGYPNVLSNLAWHLLAVGKLGEAAQMRAKVRELIATTNDPVVRARLESQDAEQELIENNTARAEISIAKSLASYQEIGNIQGLLATLQFAGYIALRLADPARAAKLIGGAERHFMNYGWSGLPLDVERKNKALEDIEIMVGQERAEALYAEGAMMKLEELFDLARAGSG